MKIGCVVQGDVRRGTAEVLSEMCSKFDYVVLSTWMCDRIKAPSGIYNLLLNDRPLNPGLNNRNLQRLTTARGIKYAKDAGCDYVLKLRTDMLPGKINIDQLLAWSNYDVKPEMRARIVMPTFRNLSVEQDWFSTIPDLFAFGHISEMEMLWGDLDFDYSLDINLPKQMLSGDGGFSPNLLELTESYCPEAELYAIFKSRLEDKVGGNLNHYKIAKNYLRLIEHNRIGMYWFHGDRGFRSIRQAWEHPWWTEATWLNKAPIVVPAGYRVSGFVSTFRMRFSPFMVRADQMRQLISWKLSKFIKKYLRK